MNISYHQGNVQSLIRSKYLLKRIDFVKRKANSKAMDNVDGFMEMKANYLCS